MTDIEANNAYGMLKGSINRMFITDSREELHALFAGAILQVADIYRYHHSRLLAEEFAKDGSEP